MFENLVNKLRNSQSEMKPAYTFYMIYLGLNMEWCPGVDTDKHNNHQIFYFPIFFWGLFPKFLNLKIYILSLLFKQIHRIFPKSMPFILPFC